MLERLDWIHAVEAQEVWRSSEQIIALAFVLKELRALLASEEMELTLG